MYGFTDTIVFCPSLAFFTVHHFLRAIATLQSDMQILDGEYNKLGDLVAKGERDNHDEK